MGIIPDHVSNAKPSFAASQNSVGLGSEPPFSASRHTDGSTRVPSMLTAHCGHSSYAKSNRLPSRKLPFVRYAAFRADRMTAERDKATVRYSRSSVRLRLFWMGRGPVRGQSELFANGHYFKRKSFRGGRSQKAMGSTARSIICSASYWFDFFSMFLENARSRASK